MCDHDFLRASDCSGVCTSCGLVRHDPPCEDFSAGWPTVAVPKSVTDAVRRAASCLDATPAVERTAAELVVQMRGRPCNVNLAAAALYAAFRAHRLDRLEKEVVARVPDVTPRLFAKYVNKLRRVSARMDRDIEAEVVLRRLVSRRLGPVGRRELCNRVRRTETVYTRLTHLYGDTKTIPTLLRMAVDEIIMLP